MIEILQAELEIARGHLDFATGEARRWETERRHLEGAVAYLQTRVEQEIAKPSPAAAEELVEPVPALTDVQTLIEHRAAHAQVMNGRVDDSEMP